MLSADSQFITLTKIESCWSIIKMRSSTKMFDGFPIALFRQTPHAFSIFCFSNYFFMCKFQFFSSCIKSLKFNVIKKFIHFDLIHYVLHYFSLWVNCMVNLVQLLVQYQTSSSDYTEKSISIYNFECI